MYIVSSSVSELLVILDLHILFFLSSWYDMIKKSQYNIRHVKVRSSKTANYS